MLFLAILIIMMLLGTAIFIGFGALVALFLPLSLFQASGLVITATFAFAVVLYLVIRILQFSNYYHTDYDYDYSDDFDEFDDENSDASFSADPKSKSVGRNEPCPCGSGLKFKKCCGNVVKF